MNCVTPCNTGLKIRVPEPRDGRGRSEGHSHTPETGPPCPRSLSKRFNSQNACCEVSYLEKKKSELYSILPGQMRDIKGTIKGHRSGRHRGTSARN